ncbi:SOS response-associated peptidase [Maribacter algicola]|uniref:Abasic site processing protein n=1 Tax=Maribacter algicola TaxID=2498892 RepID=A0A3R8RQY7_9FLAO|nr:SOS response-associated peptidase family protein [Maribacter algicola]RRQ50669.1 SOS response-associated peptidase [Maribacter algicola]
MCFSTEEFGDVKLVETYYRLDHNYVYAEPENEYKRYFNNGFVHNRSWIITQENPSILTDALWGIIPNYKSNVNPREYYKETIKYGSGLNARSEKLFDSSNYNGFKKCIIPVKGFFEPHTAKNNFKIPFYFKRKDDNPISLAGIYTVISDGTITFSILTKPASPLFIKIHNKKNRRPVILQEMDIEVWLDPTLSKNQILDVIADDLPDDKLQTWPISKDLYRGNAGQRADITEPVEYEALEIAY